MEYFTATKDGFNVEKDINKSEFYMVSQDFFYERMVLKFKHIENIACVKDFGRTSMLIQSYIDVTF